MVSTLDEKIFASYFPLIPRAAPSPDGTPHPELQERCFPQKEGRFQTSKEFLMKLLIPLASLCCVAVLAFFSPPLHAGERWGFDLGLGGSVTSSEYKDVYAAGATLPLLGYEGDRFYLRGISGGLHLFRNDRHEINAQLSYLPQRYLASWSGDEAMKQLDDRYSSMLAGLNYRFLSPYGILQATVSADILGYSNGVIARASYSYPLTLGRVTLLPSAGLTWTSCEYNRYYYGIQSDESRASGLSEYHPGSALSPNAGLAARVGLSENWSLFANGNLEFLNQEIYDSPMVENAVKLSLGAGLLYRF